MHHFTGKRDLTHQFTGEKVRCKKSASGEQLCSVESRGGGGAQGLSFGSFSSPEDARQGLYLPGLSVHLAPESAAHKAHFPASAFWFSETC